MTTKRKVRKRPGKRHPGNRKPHNSLVADGTEETKNELILRAYELQVQGYSAREIAAVIAEERSLKRVPAHTTVLQWLSDAHALAPHTRVIKSQFIAKSMERLERVVRYHLPIATDKAKVLRKHKQKMDGVTVEFEVLDEEGYDKSCEAGNQIRGSIEVGRKLLGIGTANDKPDESGRILNQNNVNTLIIQVMSSVQSGKPIELDSTHVLTTSVGRPELEDL